MRITLFFTRGVGIKTWAQTGLLSREVALYQGLQQHGAKISFITHGLADDLSYPLPNIAVYPNWKGRSPKRYEAWLPFLHAWPLMRSDVIKTNQMDGAELALRAARLYRKPLIARCGYLWSEFMSLEHGPDSPQTHHALEIEKAVFSAAQAIIVTTQEMADSIQERLPQTRPYVIPNFVDTAVFAPQAARPDVDILFIGRLHPQKNLAALLEAIAPTAYTLRIIGEGPLEASLKSRFGTLNGRVEWHPRIPNSDLPYHLNRARIFVLPSDYEGHPKTLIEAMACGRPVLVADSSGIRERVHHGRDAWVVAGTSEALRTGLETLMSQSDLCDTLGKAARETAVANYSLMHAVEKEWAILERVIRRESLD